MSNFEHPSHLVVPKPEEGWPDRTQTYNGREYVALGGEIYAPADPTTHDIQQLYGYWANEHRIPYDEQNKWIVDIGHTCGYIVRQYHEANPGPRVLDIACGTGMVSQGLRDSINPSLHVGVDITDGMLQVARSKSDLADCTFMQADVRTPVFKSKSFDVVTGSLFINHLTEKQDRLAAFEAVSDALDFGGIFIMVDTPNNPMRDDVIAEFESVFGPSEFYQHTHFSDNAPNGFMLDYYVGQKC
jgi:2-polyprenyl-3-methyl-5-hydroxy-6-metoxy-1,4-benzoquinol methylase